MVSSRNSAIAFDSNNETRSSRRSTGTFLWGEMARNQSGRFSGSMWRSSKSTFFSRNTIAARCTHGQVLKLTSRYFVMTASDESFRQIQEYVVTPCKPPLGGGVAESLAP